MGQLISIALATQKRRVCHLRLVVKSSLTPNLDAARGILKWTDDEQPVLAHRINVAQCVDLSGVYSRAAFLPPSADASE